MNGHSWKDKLAWVGMEWEIVKQTSKRYHVKVRYPQGRVSFGDGTTLEDALQNGAIGLGIDWHSVEHKMTEAAWAAMSHC